jgi:hypothetical protein
MGDQAMQWRKTEFGCAGERDGAAPAELLVAVLLDADMPGALVRDAVAAWAPSLPTARFLLFNRCPPAGLIEAVLLDALASADLPPSRLLLVGLRGTATVGLSVVLGAVPPPCAGMLAYDGLPVRTGQLSPAARQIKIRLIGWQGEGRGDEDLFAQTIHDLGAAGIDVRGTWMIGTGLTPAAIRLGAAYLGELSASALVIPRAARRPRAEVPDGS